MDAFVAGLDLGELGFARAVAAETGRPGYRPGDMLRLYVWGYLNQVRSSRHLERACRRDLEAMWLMRRLAPDYPDHRSLPARHGGADCRRSQPNADQALHGRAPVRHDQVNVGRGQISAC